jgi:hypothetical protein
MLCSPASDSDAPSDAPGGEAAAVDEEDLQAALDTLREWEEYQVHLAASDGDDVDADVEPPAEDVWHHSDGDDVEAESTAATT